MRPRSLEVAWPSAGPRSHGLPKCLCQGIYLAGYRFPTHLLDCFVGDVEPCSDHRPSGPLRARFSGPTLLWPGPECRWKRRVSISPCRLPGDGTPAPEAQSAVYPLFISSLRPLEVEPCLGSIAPSFEHGLRLQSVSAEDLACFRHV